MPGAINKELLMSLRKFIRPQARNANDTEDILQNVLIKIMKNGDDISSASFLPWIQTVCRTTSIDYYRKNKSNFGQIEEGRERDQEYEENTLASLLAKCVRPLLENLSPEDSKLLRAIELDGVSQKDLAQKMDVDYSALKSKVQRARKKLKEEIIDCCSIELDRRNTPINIKSKRKIDCC